MTAESKPEALKPAVSKPEVAAPKKAEKPAVSGWDKADKWIERIIKLLFGLLTIIGLVLGWTKGKDWRQKLKTDRAKKVREYFKTGFGVVEGIAKVTAWKGDDKLVEALKRVEEWLFDDGDKPLSTAEVGAVKKEAADMAAVDKAGNGKKLTTMDAKVVTRRGS